MQYNAIQCKTMQYNAKRATYIQYIIQSNGAKLQYTFHIIAQPLTSNTFYFITLCFTILVGATIVPQDVLIFCWKKSRLLEYFTFFHNSLCCSDSTHFALLYL